jgi:hypothetical protein
MAEQTRDLKPGTAISFRVMAAPGMSAVEAFPLWLRYTFLSFLANQRVLAE